MPTPAECCTAPLISSWKGLVCQTCRNCHRSAHCCRTSTGSTMSDPKKPAGRSTRNTGRPAATGRSETVRPRPAKAAPADNADELDGPDGVRLQKVLASAGVASRRKAEELIKA